MCFTQCGAKQNPNVPSPCRDSGSSGCTGNLHGECGVTERQLKTLFSILEIDFHDSVLIPRHVRLVIQVNMIRYEYTASKDL